MSNKLALIMNTPIEELVPAMIAWNNEELMVAVKSALQQYEGVEYTDEQMDIAKKDRALLNAFAKSLNDERLRIGKIYLAPYERFKGEVDVVLGEVKRASGCIDTQIKAHEQAEQEKKKQKIRDYYDSVVGEFKTLIPFERIMQSKWLNASAKEKAIYSEIDKIIDNAILAMSAIEALHSEHETAVKAFYFRTLDISAALLENDRLVHEKQRIAEMKARREAEEKARTQTVVREPTVSQAAPPEPKLMRVGFHVEGTVEQLAALRNFLIQNNIKFYKI